MPRSRSSGRGDRRTQTPGPCKTAEKHQILSMLTIWAFSVVSSGPGGFVRGSRRVLYRDRSSRPGVVPVSARKSAIRCA
jgi:hypothetical protein